MSTVLTFRIDEELAQKLQEASEWSGRRRSDIVREALRRYLALLEFEALRSRILPEAKKRGYLTDDDVFAEVS